VTTLVPRMKSHRLAILVAFDAAAWIVGYVGFTWLRYDQDSSSVPWFGTLSMAAATAIVYTLAAWVSRLHWGRATLASLEEMLLLGTVAVAVGSVFTVVNLSYPWIPRSVPAGATLGMLVIAAWGRATWRRGRERSVRSFGGEGGGERILVLGGGEAGAQLVVSMLRDPERRWRPVGILDDDPHKRHLRIRGVPVLGGTHDLVGHVSETRAESVVIAIPSADADTVSRLRAAAAEAGVTLKVLPSITQLVTGNVDIHDIRDIDLTDVLGRKQLDTDLDAIAGSIKGRRVLVTGAGGSIGAELCRQLWRFEPGELMMLDRDESALHAVQLSLHGRALLDSDDVILCDIRDRSALVGVFARRRPQVVFHAAALKHLPMLEQYPAEAVKTNILGTRNVLDAAEAYDVATFVNISTDKAANPCSVLGYSKRIAESLTALRSREVDGTYVSVRFGNVLGSRGSVLASFAAQIAQGGPMTVTHEDVTRYFMTIEEACQLVIQAAAIGRPGEALVLDMGEPVRILDVAHQLMEQSGRRLSIEFTGLRAGEKMHEDLFGDGEPRDVRPAHPLVSHVPVPAVLPGQIEALPVTGPPGVVRDAMSDLCEALQRQSAARVGVDAAQSHSSVVGAA
jgi:FlaA1/EpsC-like NDP-sugar epimerase